MAHEGQILATLLVPGGLLAGIVAAGSIPVYSMSGMETTCRPPDPYFGAGTGHCVTTGGPGVGTWTLLTIALILTVGGPLFTTFWLTRRARRLI